MKERGIGGEGRGGGGGGVGGGGGRGGGGGGGGVGRERKSFRTFQLNPEVCTRQHKTYHPDHYSKIKLSATLR